jgi:precorrin-6A/cobalt-precorrin-6A reductase
MTAARRILLLGGTGEARALAAAIAARFGERIELVVSLAGRTQQPAAYAGASRTGGFGGARGLADYVRRERIDLVVDATHPFAATISDHAREAAAETGVELLALSRPEWQPVPGDRWTVVPDAAAAANAAGPLGERVFIAFGGREIEAFAGLAGKWFLVRRIEPPAGRLPLDRYEICLGRGPFSLEDERDLLRRHRIDVVVTKASGGAATRAKLDAARELGLPVVMIRRPGPDAAPGVPTVEAALRRIASFVESRGIDRPPPSS